MFSENDLKQFKEKGIHLEVVEQQIANFRKGFPYMDVVKAATIGDGIKSPDQEQLSEALNEFDTQKQALSLLKFVPASGAATRMFKALYEFVASEKANRVKTLNDLKAEGFDATHDFINNLHRFAFYEELAQALDADGKNIDDLLKKGDYKTIIRYFLDDGLGYGQLPKGLLAFHRYENEKRTPVDEHFVEAAHYASSNGKARLHFTVSPEHKQGFNKLVSSVKPSYEDYYRLEYDVEFSEQKPSTDTIAVDLNNEPFRNPDGTILFRPGGHGALIENLNDLDADIVFIKNIDNVVPDKLKSTTHKYKKLLAGMLIQYQQKIFDYLRQLQSENGASVHLLEEISKFLANDLNILPADKFEPKTDKETIQYMIAKLNRPIRVCGMVKNEGEPGGGPFWTVNSDNTVSLQIVEKSQIDFGDEEKKEIVDHATHFNPVDLVCGIKDYLGNQFDLKEFVDQNTGFITEKSKDGRQLKAQELPGLWNGAMADWITIFVEVPIETFNPVKTVNDLLRVEHQANNIK